jgi:hypothetical protein
VSEHYPKRRKTPVPKDRWRCAEQGKKSENETENLKDLKCFVIREMRGF